MAAEPYPAPPLAQMAADHTAQQPNETTQSTTDGRRTAPLHVSKNQKQIQGGFCHDEAWVYVVEL